MLRDLIDFDLVTNTFLHVLIDYILFSSHINVGTNSEVRSQLRTFINKWFIHYLLINSYI